MRTHQQIDARSLALAQAIAEKVDADLSREGLRAARENCARWLSAAYSPAVDEWAQILEQDWPTVRTVLLDPSENSQRRRQSNPFCDVITAEERASIFDEYSHESFADRGVASSYDHSTLSLGIS